MRFLLSIIILTLLVTYAVIPFIQYIMKFFRSEAKRIDNAFNKNENEEENENEQ
jgi:antibiotic biosynthesis monooxygenase (ABM) superfamily enzyme